MNLNLLVDSLSKAGSAPSLVSQSNQTGPMRVSLEHPPCSAIGTEESVWADYPAQDPHTVPCEGSPRRVVSVEWQHGLNQGSGLRRVIDGHCRGQLERWAW